MKTKSVCEGLDHFDPASASEHTPLEGHQCHSCEDKHFYKRCKTCLHEYCNRIYLVCPRCKEQKHTGSAITPWTIEEPSKGFDGFIIHGADNVELATLLNSNEKDSKANAAYIVRAVNTHEELLDIIKTLDAFFDNNTPVSPSALCGESDTFKQAVKKAIARASGESR